MRKQPPIHELKKALAKLKRAKFTPSEAYELANWLGQCISTRVNSNEGLSDEDWEEGKLEMVESILKGK